MKEWII